MKLNQGLIVLCGLLVIGGCTVGTPPQTITHSHAPLTEQEVGQQRANQQRIAQCKADETYYEDLKFQIRLNNEYLLNDFFDEHNTPFEQRIQYLQAVKTKSGVKSMREVLGRKILSYSCW